MLPYSLIGHADKQTITVFVDGEPLVADNTHPRFTTIVEAVLAGETDVYDLFDQSVAAAKHFEGLSERVTVAGGTIYLDGDPVHNALTSQVVRFLDEGVEDWVPLVRFFEKVQANPQEHSREQLYNWLTRYKFTLTDDGDFIAYKGLRSDRTSIHSGPAIVNGLAMNGHVPNEDGSLVEIARSAVQHNPAVGCASGLHAGTYSYAVGFGQRVVSVKVNPRDVVSVPTDSGEQKLRVCRYTVIEEVKGENQQAVWYSNPDGFVQGLEDRGWTPDATL